MDQNQNPMNQNEGGVPGVSQEGPVGAPIGGMTPPPAPRGEGGKKSLGPIIAIVIIIVLLVLGGLYLWGGQLLDRDLTPEEILNEEDAMLEDLEAQGTSDEVADIEADLDMTDFEGIDAELEDIENELNIL